MRIAATPYNLASEAALAIYSKVLDSVRADRLVETAVQRIGDALFVQGHHIDLSNFDRIWIAGAGKASVSMASAVANILGDRLTGGLIITKTGHSEPIEGLEVLEAAHPIPDLSSLEAGRRMLDFASTLKEQDFVLFLLSGGASSLMEAPRVGIDLEDLQQVNHWAMASGLNIGQLNYLRSKLSMMKGGGLADAFLPATVVVLVLSDVVGNDLQTIGSGPFTRPSLRSMENNAGRSHFIYPKEGTFRDVVHTALNANELRIPSLSEPVDHYVIGSISLAVHAAADAAQELGLLPLPFGDAMTGEAREMAVRICQHARKRESRNSCMIFGGETTVTIRGKGLGGRCQEMAVAAAEQVSAMPNTCFLAGSTDGTDGPTDEAGGLVDPYSHERARLAGYSASESLRLNASHDFLKGCDGLLVTGPTGSNVNDLVLVVHVDE